MTYNSFQENINWPLNHIITKRESNLSLSHFNYSNDYNFYASHCILHWDVVNDLKIAWFEQELILKPYPKSFIKVIIFKMGLHLGVFGVPPLHSHTHFIHFESTFDSWPTLASCSTHFPCFDPTLVVNPKLVSWHCFLPKVWNVWN
jgi:hypothetical protein